MRKHGKIDANQRQIISDLRGLGYGVISLAPMGNGLADLLIGARGRNLLFEVKNPDLSPSERRLTTQQNEFHESWPGQIGIALKTEDILRVIEADE